MSRAKLRIGVSACLLGREVRWDGGHRRDAIVADLLGREVSWIPVCPELELGLGVPREPIRLVGPSRAPRLVSESGIEHGPAMRRFAEVRVRALARLGLAGFVTKADSPSCGLRGVRVHPRGGGRPRRDGTGAFVSVLVERLPGLPVVEERELHRADRRDAFLEAARAYAAQRGPRNNRSRPR